MCHIRFILIEALQLQMRGFCSKENSRYFGRDILDKPLLIPTQESIAQTATHHDPLGHLLTKKPPESKSLEAFWGKAAFMPRRHEP